MITTISLPQLPRRSAWTTKAARALCANTYPDFIVRLVSGATYLIKTKGLEDVEVVFKDARANQWAKDMRAFTGVGWYFHKVPYSQFQTSTAITFTDLTAELAVGVRCAHANTSANNLTTGVGAPGVGRWERLAGKG